MVSAFESLPEWIRSAVSGVAIIVEDRPPPGAGPEHGLLLGIFHGIPMTRHGQRVPGSLPDQIVLYREPILAACSRPQEAPDRIRTVLLHEIGHALGMTEQRLRDLGVN